MAKLVPSFEDARKLIDVAHLIHLNATLMYDDVGIAMMEYAMTLVQTASFAAVKVNESSLNNFIETLLKTTALRKMLNWNGSGQGTVQKPDAVFLITFTDDTGVRKEALLYYESDSNAKTDPKYRKQIARKMYQSTCGSTQWNDRLPVVTVRANVFSGPPVELAVAASEAACTSRSQLEAQQAIDFLNQLCAAHVWVARQVALMVHEDGVLWDLATADGKRFDHHVLVGAMRVDAMNTVMTMFGDAAGTGQNTTVDLRHSVWSVPYTAPVQCISVQRFDDMIKFNAMIPYRLRAVNTFHFDGIVTLQQLWAMIRSIADKEPNQYWNNTIGKALGIPTQGLKTALYTTPGNLTIDSFDMTDDFTTAGKYKDILTLIVTRYYDCICHAYYQHIVNLLEWKMPDGSDAVDMSPRLKRLKIESNKNINGLQARNQAQNLDELRMVDGLGITAKADCLNAVCLRSMLDTLPNIDRNLEQYIDSFKSPYVVLFLRMIRCTNLMAFEHLAKTFDSAHLTEAFARKVGMFPVGTIADIDYIMKYTTHNTHHIHSLYFKVRNDASNVLPEVFEHSKEYLYMIAIMNDIVLNQTEVGDKYLKDSPLYFKFLLCAKPLYDLVHSLKFNINISNAPRPIQKDINLHTSWLAETKSDWRRKAAMTILRTFTSGRLTYYIYEDYIDDMRTIAGNYRSSSYKDLVALLQSEEDNDADSDCAQEVQGSPILLSWPLRDINVFRGCSKRRRERHAMTGIMYYDFPFHRKMHQDNSMHRDEMTMFRTLLQIKETQRANQIIRNTNYDTEGAIRSPVPPVVIPPVMTSSVHDVETKRLEQQRKCPRWTEFANAMRLVPAPAAWKPAQPEILSSSLATEVAWRWKSVMIQTILLSALNGIVQLLMDNRSSTTKTQIRDVYTKQGIESIRDVLVGERFKMTDISKICRWHGTLEPTCTAVHIAIVTNPLMPIPPVLSLIDTTVMKQHGGRRIFSQRIEEGIGLPNDIIGNKYGDKSFIHKRLISETINAIGEEIISKYNASELKLFQCRLYKTDEPTEEEKADWATASDFLNLSGTLFSF